MKNKKIAEISDERGNGDGWWIYLNKAYADFDNDPSWPTRQIHEQRKADAMDRVRRAQLITPEDFKKFPHLADHLPVS